MNDSPLETLQAWLEKAINYERLAQNSPFRAKFSLESMERLSAKFGSPQKSFKSVHIAGSKGKGSVSQFTAAILHEAGYSEGLYTSPHILDFSERVRTAYGVFDKSVYKTAAEILMNRASTSDATWFELVTLFSFLCFKTAQVDWGVFETGMGGRLDATNVLLPKICVITPIELEHTEILGDTIEKIAAEKAGIFKRGVPVCVAPQKKEARAVFEKKAAELDCPIFFLEDIPHSPSFALAESGMDVTIDFGNYAVNKKRLFKRPLSARLKMIGGIQVQNAALAALACKVLFPDMDETAIENGLSSSKLSGRFDILHYNYNKSYNVRIIIDGAHTVNSIAKTLETLSGISAGKKTHLLFACAADKHVEEIALQILSGPVHFSHITLTLPGSFKKGDLPAAQKAFSSASEKNERITADADFKRAILSALKNAAEDEADLLVTGSFYLAGEVYKIIQ